MQNKNYSIFTTSSNLSISLFKNWIRSTLIPVDYTRTVEIPELLNISSILTEQRSLKILDIGSPQILSLFLASFSKNWEITYINAFQEEIDDLLFKKHALKLNNIRVLKHDVTTPIPISDKFDYIFSCSVFEHIIPEENGDTIAASLIGSYLTPGGVFAISVPFSKTAFNEYVNCDVYGRPNPEACKMFFQRFYDEPSLTKRIIDVSGLNLNNISFIGERFWYPDTPHKRLAISLGSSFIGFLLGRFNRILSWCFMNKSKTWRSLRKPYLAIALMQKGTDHA